VDAQHGTPDAGGDAVVLFSGTGRHGCTRGDDDVAMTPDARGIPDDLPASSDDGFEIGMALA
jgi:hypothetical protein